MNKKEFQNWVKHNEYNPIKSEGICVFWFDDWSKSDEHKANNCEYVQDHYEDDGCHFVQVSWDFAQSCEFDPENNKGDDF